ncbi:Flp family type IVb pilin [Methylobacillus flagellatus]|uniref:Flp family type IVb pilin n=1 Tax=Methylobacillus flagellatus TaxID=405 RepID=UPI002853F638|nr:Flp family type IVb pilin [Methylobacillus flagellatus]MDR5171605.1 Flp family type IVb pilin [Methylobacillus flagellatus]
MFATMKQWLVNFYLDEEGASGIEYALIAAMVAVVLASFVGTSGISGKVKNIFDAISTALTTAS